MENHKEEIVNQEPKSFSKTFITRLKRNQVDRARAALLETVCFDPSSTTVGGILDALEIDGGESGHIMLDLFRRLSMRDIANCVTQGREKGQQGLKVATERPKRTAKAVPAPSALRVELDGDDFSGEGDGVEGDAEGYREAGGGAYDSIRDGESPLARFGDKAPKKKKKKNKNKNKSKGKGKGKSKSKVGGLDHGGEASGSVGGEQSPGGGDLNSDTVLEAFELLNSIDEDSAISSAEIRDRIGGSAADLRPVLITLQSEGHIGKCGEARGTRYFLLDE